MKKNLIKYEEFVKESSDFRVNESDIVNQERLSNKMVEIFNKQIKTELDSSQMYRAMSCWLNDENWPSGTKLFFKYADEELTHMSKIYEYLFVKNCKAVVPVCNEHKSDYKDIRDLVEKALEHEIEITKNWEDISDTARDEKDNTSYEFAQWFLTEQISEEEKLRYILEKMDLDMPNYEIDKLFDNYEKN